MIRRALIPALAVPVVLALGCGGEQRDVDEKKFLATAQAGDAQVKKMYELDPTAEHRFNEGNRTGRRGAFAAIAATFTLTAKAKNGAVLKVYRGIAPRAVS